MHCFHRPSNPSPNYSLAKSMSLIFTGTNAVCHTYKHIYSIHLLSNQKLWCHSNDVKSILKVCTNTHHDKMQCYNTWWFSISFRWPPGRVSSKGLAHNLAQSRNAETTGELDHLWADPNHRDLQLCVPSGVGVSFRGVQTRPLVVTPHPLILFVPKSPWGPVRAHQKHTQTHATVSAIFPNARIGRKYPVLKCRNRKVIMYHYM